MCNVWDVWCPKAVETSIRDEVTSDPLNVFWLFQPVQGFDYAKKHIGRPGDETTSVTKETLLLALPARDAPLSLERKTYQDGTANKRPSSTDMHKGG